MRLFALIIVGCGWLMWWSITTMEEAQRRCADKGLVAIYSREHTKWFCVDAELP